MSNLNYIFNKKYFDSLDNSHFKKINEKIIKTKFSGQLYKPVYSQNENYLNFYMKTQYPGLLLGLGNLHQVDEGDDNIKLGFTLDYVTGLPYIPGSTVKGVLRNAFHNYPDFVCEIIKGKPFDKINMEKLERHIFGEWCGDNNEQKKLTIPIEKRDVFFDTIIVKSGKDDRILGIDYITPHKNKDNKPELDELSEPNPISMLKVISNVVFEFRFKLVDSNIDGIEITKEDKLDLFKLLLEYLGIGAKTNTGFGYMETVDMDKSELSDSYKFKKISSKKSTTNDIIGRCKVCGKPTRIDKKTNKYFEYCWDHKEYAWKR